MNWPSQLIIVRHGQSAGNVARDEAHETLADRIALNNRDADVPLSELGYQQAKALGRWFAGMPEHERPEVLLSSPYRRALQTAETFRAAGGTGGDVPICFDERLREKEFGILDGLTTTGVANVFPDQAEFRRLLGKFYHRPPGGESWCDVILRLRSVLDTISLHHCNQRVMIFTHQVVVLCLRYIIETLDEAAILAIDREADVANCSITEFRLEPGDGGKLALTRYNVTAPMEQAETPVTREPDAIAGRRG
ncbi:phosphoglycerate mutase [Tsuneonella deserti]|uniref:Phosphoglycerate mutase n=1 Tax=Tsuneonella deserti TaxID=2035528 RepID=A0ABQ1S889_9SPHN|nr:histidine phosphatase family protein [Tsuneonella deserti]GGD93782.1 phosphoglycerate mutase [Tsuneonella deserti]